MDSLYNTIFDMSEGIPGALTVIQLSINKGGLPTLIDWNIRGSALWDKYTKCGKDITKLLTLAKTEIEARNKDTNMV
jgi:hypothetical protein